MRPGARAEWRYAQIGSAEIAYQVLGAGPALVLLHGLSGSSRWWRYNAGPLAERFQVHVIDLIGFGASRGQRFVLREAAALVGAWMQQIGLARASLVGHSMGGHIAAELAAREPGCVERLVLVDAPVLPFGYGYGRHALGMLRELRQLRANFLPVLVADGLRAGPATLWRAAGELLRADLRPQIERIAAPTLLVWGARDALVPLALGQALCEALPQAGLLVLAGAGHNAMWDCPAAFNREVLAFLAGGDLTLGQREITCG